jgi:hypothetical protein
MLDPDVRRVLDGTSIAHLTTILPDGSPHTVPLWIGATATGSSSSPARARARHATCAANLGWRCPSRPPTTVRARCRPWAVVEWLGGEAAWEVIDQLSTKYTGASYSRGQERVVAVIEPERQTVGVG